MRRVTGAITEEASYASRKASTSRRVAQGKYAGANVAMQVSDSERD